MWENLEKTELIELIYKLEKENKELKDKLYGFNKKSEPIEENTKNNISNYVKKSKLLPNERIYLKRLASFTNPRFYELQKLRMPVYNTPRTISCFEEDERFLILPRGCIDGIKDICPNSNI